MFTEVHFAVQVFDKFDPICKRSLGASQKIKQPAHIAVMEKKTVHPFRHLITGVEGDVLWVLARSRISRHASDIARICGRSKSQVQAVLNRLHDARIVDRTLLDGWSWNCLNDAHPFSPHLRAMARIDFNPNDVEIPKAAGAPDLWSLD